MTTGISTIGYICPKGQKWDKYTRKCIKEDSMDIIDKIDQILEFKIKKVVRGGKLKKKIICPPGFKVVKGRCVKMSPIEKRKRSKAARRTQRKIQAGSTARLLRKRAKSMSKRAGLLPSPQPSGDIKFEK